MIWPCHFYPHTTFIEGLKCQPRRSVVPVIFHTTQNMWHCVLCYKYLLLEQMTWSFPFSDWILYTGTVVNQAIPAFRVYLNDDRDLNHTWPRPQCQWEWTSISSSSNSKAIKSFIHSNPRLRVFNDLLYFKYPYTPCCISKFMLVRSNFVLVWQNVLIQYSMLLYVVLCQIPNTSFIISQFKQENWWYYL